MVLCVGVCVGRRFASLDLTIEWASISENRAGTISETWTKLALENLWLVFARVGKGPPAAAGLAALAHACGGGARCARDSPVSGVYRVAEWKRKAVKWCAHR